MRIVAVVIALALGGCTLSGLGAAAKIGKDSTVAPERAQVRPEYGKISLQGECVPERIACECPGTKAPRVASRDDP